MFKYEFHSELNILNVTATDVIQIKDIVNYAHEVLSRDLITAGTMEYYDLSHVTNMDIDFRSACELSSTLREWVNRGWHGSVFYTPETYQFGIIRMIGSVLEGVQAMPEVSLLPTSEQLLLNEVRQIIDTHRLSIGIHQTDSSQ